MDHVLNKCTKDEFLEYNQAIQNLLCGNQFFHITHHPYTSFMYHCVRSEFHMVSSRSDYKPWPYARTAKTSLHEFSISNLSPENFYAYSLNRVLELQNLAIRDFEHEMKKIRKNLKDAKKQTINTMNEIKRIKLNDEIKKLNF